jgi:hypothetical protein
LIVLVIARVPAALLDIQRSLISYRRKRIARLSGEESLSILILGDISTHHTK